MLTIEAGSRGFVARTMLTFLRKIGLSSPKARSACKVISTIVAKCSFTIYLSRETEFWDSKRDLLTIEVVDPTPSVTVGPPSASDSTPRLRHLASCTIFDGLGGSVCSERCPLRQAAAQC